MCIFIGGEIGWVGVGGRSPPTHPPTHPVAGMSLSVGRRPGDFGFPPPIKKRQPGYTGSTVDVEESMVLQEHMLTTVASGGWGALPPRPPQLACAHGHPPATAPKRWPIVDTLTHSKWPPVTQKKLSRVTVKRV